MTSMQFIADEINEWRKLEVLLKEQFNLLVLSASNEANDLLMLHLDGPTASALTLDRDLADHLREAFIEVGGSEVSLNVRDAVHLYVQDKIHSLGRDLLEVAADIVNPRRAE